MCWRPARISRKKSCRLTKAARPGLGNISKMLGRLATVALLLASFSAALLARSRTPSSGPSGKPVHVHQYKRKDGTLVHSHNRALPGTTKLKSPPKVSTPRPSSSAQRHSISPARSSAMKHEFERKNPCPSTGKTGGPCPGYVVDHIQPLACGGQDAPSNMQWQSEADAKRKDSWERKGCSP